VKTFLIALLVTTLGLGAQTLPPPASPTATTNAAGAPRTIPTLPSPTLPRPVPTQPAGTGAAAVPPSFPVPGAQMQPAQPVPAAAIPAAAAPATAPAPGDELISSSIINFTAADLNQVLTIYAELVGRTVLRPATLPGASIVLKAQTPLTRREAIQALDAVLAMNGVAMINFGEKFVKAVPSTMAPATGQEVNTDDPDQLPIIGSYVTRVVQTKYIKPSELVPTLTPFQSAANAILPVDSSQILVLRDNIENVKRMLEMVEKVDVMVEAEFISEVIPIKFAKAEDIATALNSLSSGGGGGTTVGQSSAGARTTGARTTTGAARPGQPGYNPSQTGGLMQQGATGTPSAGGTFSDRLQQIIRRASSSSGNLEIIGETKIIADARSNSLLIFATRQDMKMVKDIVEKLDVVLAQVLIETIIMDISLGNSLDFGISGLQAKREFSGSFTGAGGMNTTKLFDFDGASSTNGLTGLLGSGLRYFGKIDDDIYISLEAMAQDGRANVIQKPRIQTSHATPASIFIGETVPYISGTYFGYGGSSPSSSYQQLRVGIGLNVTPFINQDGLVVMQIDQQIEELGDSVNIDGNEVPKTTSRTLQAEVAVRDNETILLGGFIRNRDATSKSGVPFLKDIPLLGYLFRSTSNEKERKELIVLMRPTVLRTPEIAAMQVAVEKERLPLVRAAEADLEKIEGQGKTNPRAQKDLFKQVTPFTPEEIEAFSPAEEVKP
jgi:general secretion pathway protein D